MSPPIGLFDSGVGGITVLQALEHLLPHQDCIYFGDSAHFPYQQKSPAELIRYTSQITAFLLSQGIQLLIIACHTATIHTLSVLQAHFPLPIVGMVEPSLTALKNETKNQRIALLATRSTLQSETYQNAISSQLPNSSLMTLSCPQLEETIERGEKPTQETIRKCLEPLHSENIDTLLLACTHYPHILLEIEEELPSETTVINPAFEVAKQAKTQLPQPPSKSHAPHHLLYTSGDQGAFEKFLLSHPLAASYEVKHCSLPA